MDNTIDISAILTPIEGDDPAGEDLYIFLIDEINEAIREDDPRQPVPVGQKQHKTAHWHTVIDICANALIERTKDLRIAVWLTHGLVMTSGFDGLNTSMEILTGLFRNFWGSFYPKIEDNDFDAVVNHLKLMDNKLGLGNERLSWNDHTDTPENLDMAKKVSDCIEAFDNFVTIISQEDKLGQEAPSLDKLESRLNPLREKAFDMLKSKETVEIPDDPEPEANPDMREQNITTAAVLQESSAINNKIASTHSVQSSAPEHYSLELIADISPIEKNLWNNSLALLRTSDLKTALTPLLNAASIAPSIRGKTRFRFMIAKLCLQAKRPDMARPIVEELHEMVEKLNLEQWESPLWVAEVLDAFYQCLTMDQDANDADLRTADNLFQQLCIKDITKAIKCKTAVNEL